jgi:predicted Fe-Mo cluster-binding NifX family protein
MLAATREQCGEVMPQMTHCHQCRADAIGMLGEDRSQQFLFTPTETAPAPWLPTLHKRARLHASIATQGESDEADACLVAVASTRGDVIDCHFGHADRFRIYSLSSAGVVLVNERFTPKYCQGSDECEPQESEARMAAIMALLADVKAVFCSRIGYGPWQQLEAQVLSLASMTRGNRSSRRLRAGGKRHVSSGNNTIVTRGGMTAFAQHDWLRRLLHLYAHGEGCYPLQMGLSDTRWLAISAHIPLDCAPSDVVLRRTLMSELIASRKEERTQLADWLACHMLPAAEPMHQIIASVSLAFNHLWQDLGLSSREELRELMTDCFPQLVEMNSENMRWKKFFYRQRCLQTEGNSFVARPVVTHVANGSSVSMH